MLLLFFFVLLSYNSLSRENLQQERIKVAKGQICEVVEIKGDYHDTLSIVKVLKDDGSGKNDTNFIIQSRKVLDSHTVHFKLIVKETAEPGEHALMIMTKAGTVEFPDLLLVAE